MNIDQSCGLHCDVVYKCLYSFMWFSVMSYPIITQYCLNLFALIKWHKVLLKTFIYLILVTQVVYMLCMNEEVGIMFYV